MIELEEPAVIGTWIPVSHSLLDDVLPVGAWINTMLLRSMFANLFGESTVSAMDLIERGSAQWDALIFEDDEEWWA